MGTIADKLTYLNTTKDEIKTSIEAKGVSVPTNATFRDYADLIMDIEGGGGGTDYLAERIAGNTISTYTYNGTTIESQSLASSNFGTLNLPNATSLEVNAIENSTISTLNIPNATELKDYCLQKSVIENLNAQNVEILGSYSLYSSNINTLNAPNITTLKYQALNSSTITNYNLSNVKKIGGYNLNYDIIKDGNIDFSNLDIFEYDAIESKLESTIYDIDNPLLIKCKEQNLDTSSYSLYYGIHSSAYNICVNLLVESEDIIEIGNFNRILELGSTPTGLERHNLKCLKGKFYWNPSPSGNTFVYYNANLRNLDIYKIRNITSLVKSFLKPGKTSSLSNLTIVIRDESGVATANTTSNFNNFWNGTTTSVLPAALYVPDALVDTYKSATGWSQWASVIYPLSEYIDPFGEVYTPPTTDYDEEL